MIRIDGLSTDRYGRLHAPNGDVIIGVVTRREVPRPVPLPQAPPYTLSDCKRDFTWRKCIKAVTPICCCAGIVLSFILSKMQTARGDNIGDDNN